jgi:hypothetical protein
MATLFKGDVSYMKNHDRDGKSKTASAVDGAHYPEQDEIDREPDSSTGANHDEIAARAHELWIQRGRPQGSAEKDWYEAAEQLRAKTNSQKSRSAESGSVQR